MNDETICYATIRERRIRRIGVTLIEVLVVLLTVSLLLQLSLCGILAARETARRAKCRDNLRRIGAGIQAHERQIGHFPTGGWGFLWVGDPDRGTGRKQPGGWIYNVLPYVGHVEVHDSSRGMRGQAKIDANSAMCSTALELFACPSRRNAGQPLPYLHRKQRYGNYFPPDKVGKSDYAGNAGDLFAEDTENNVGPPSYEVVDNGGLDDPRYWIDRSKMTGIFYQLSVTNRDDVVDGLSNTYFVGEKYLDPMRYTSLHSTFGDNQCMYIGADSDISRWAGHFDGRDLIPRQDRTNFMHDQSFGSAHSSGCNILYGDGSVRTISYSIDGILHKRMANRADSEVLNEKSLELSKHLE